MGSSELYSRSRNAECYPSLGRHTFEEMASIETLSGVKAALRGTAYKSILKIHRMAEVITTEAA